MLRESGVCALHLQTDFELAHPSLTMPPFARIPSAESRSLLLPPIRVSLQVLQSLCRPQCAPTVLPAHPSRCPGQRRTLHLYRAAETKTTVGKHKVMVFEPYEIPKPGISTHRVNLVDGGDDAAIIKKNISLGKLLYEHIKPGHMLYLTQTMSKKTSESLDELKTEKILSEYRNYAIVKSHTHSVNAVKKKQRYQVGRLKVVPFNLASPVEHVKLSLDRAYQFVEAGSPVEISIRFKGAKLSRSERLTRGDPNVWPWMHQHFPHLRPDFILKAMPKNSIYRVHPMSDGRVVQFVVSRPIRRIPPMLLTRRLLKMKKMVKKSVDGGRQGQLPALMRKDLVASGHEDYSLKTGLVRRQARQMFGLEDKDWHNTWGFEKDKENVPIRGTVEQREYRKEMHQRIRKWEKRHGKRIRIRRGAWTMGKGLEEKPS